MISEQEMMDQLLTLKGMTIRTGIIHEAQVLQLQLWPLVLFKDALTSSADIDPKTKNITFKIFTNKKPNKKEFKTANDRLIDWCRFILWDETSINIKIMEAKDVKRSSGSKSKRKSN